jgi:hypothetical protein
MDLPLVRPSNRFLVMERDRRWLSALGFLLLLAVVLAAALFLVGWPRLKSTSLHYDLVGLRARVEALQRRERELEIELEVERDPSRLAERAAALGLVPPPVPVLPAERGPS